MPASRKHRKYARWSAETRARERPLDEVPDPAVRRISLPEHDVPRGQRPVDADAAAIAVELRRLRRKLRWARWIPWRRRKRPAIQARIDELSAQRRRLRQDPHERVDDEDRFAAIKNGDPKYSMMVRECAAAIDMTPDEVEVIWRAASAAAHGKNWFQHVGYGIDVGDEYEPGHFRARLTPDAEPITRTVTSAAHLVRHGVLQFVVAGGHDPAPIYSAALRQLVDETPRKSD